MKPVAAIACQQVTDISRQFVAHLGERFEAIYCADEGFLAALGETTDGVALHPLSALGDADRLCVYFPRGHEWVDDTVVQMIEDAHARNTTAYLNKYQWGYCPLVTRDTDLGRRFLNHRKPIQMIAASAARKADHYVSSAAFGRPHAFYLDTTQDEGRAAVGHMVETGTGQAQLDQKIFPSTFAVLNHGFMQEQVARLAMFSNLEGKRVLEIGASPSNPVLARLLIDQYGCDYTGVNIEPFEYPGAEGMALISEDIHKVGFRRNQFDVVFSIAVWEHIPNPLPVFDAVADWLRPGGVHYGIFQNWMSRVGHHVFSPRAPAHLVPAWGHLVYSPEELGQQITAAGGTPEVAATITDFVHNSPEINRVPTRDFVSKILSGPLEVLYLDGRGHGRIDPRAREIAADHPELNAEELSCLGLEFALRKSEFDIRRWPTSFRTESQDAE